MASYSIEISRSAEGELKRIPREDQKRVLRAILDLADNPLPKGARKLSGYDDTYRIRVGRYRVLYRVEEKKLVVILLKLGHRKDVYR